MRFFACYALLGVWLTVLIVFRGNLECTAVGRGRWGGGGMANGLRWATHEGSLRFDCERDACLAGWISDVHFAFGLGVMSTRTLPFPCCGFFCEVPPPPPSIPRATPMLLTFTWTLSTFRAVTIGRVGGGTGRLRRMSLLISSARAAKGTATRAYGSGARLSRPSTLLRWPTQPRQEVKMRALHPRLSMTV